MEHPSRRADPLITRQPATRPHSGGFRLDDRVLLAGVLVVLGVSLVIFASLVISGAGRLGGGNEDPAPTVAGQLAALGGETPTSEAIPTVVVPTSAAIPTPTPVTDAAAVTDAATNPEPTLPANSSGDEATAAPTEAPTAEDDETETSGDVDRTDFDAVAAANNLPPPLPDNGTTAQTHFYGDSGRPEIALTFDLGSDRGFTEDILDILKERGIRGSFGVTGYWAEQNPDLLQRIVDDGHQLFNHTYTHSSFTGASTGAEPLTREERIEEIRSTDELVYETTGYEMAPYFRLPYGDGSDDPEVANDIYGAGYYLTIMWTCDSYGWKQWTAAEIIQHCLADTGQGGIVLMHVGSDGTDQTALPGLIDEFAADGYDFVTVAEVLAPAADDE